MESIKAIPPAWWGSRGVVRCPTLDTCSQTFWTGLLFALLEMVIIISDTLKYGVFEVSKFLSIMLWVYSAACDPSKSDETGPGYQYQAIYSIEATTLTLVKPLLLTKFSWPHRVRRLSDSLYPCRSATAYHNPWWGRKNTHPQYGFGVG